MEMHYADLGTCGDATGTVVVIDVVRAFTTAAYAFAAGARDILPVGSIEEALALRRRFPDALVMGSENRKRPQQFDFGNSPSALIGQDLRGRRMIQRTPMGTQGIVRSTRASTLLASSFVCAQATADYIERQAPQRVTFVITDDTGEDRACADYLAGLLGAEMPEVNTLFEAIRSSWMRFIHAGVVRGKITAATAAQLEADLALCTQLDLFDFAMEVQRREGLLVMEAVREWQPTARITP
jgi:2-phosphosulfolactate phosphatase